MLHYTLYDLVVFTQNEKRMVEKVLPKAYEEQDMNPSEETVRNILNYSKALSVRKSKKINRIRLILN